MSDLPRYPTDAAERESQATAGDSGPQYASWGSRVGAYLIDSAVFVLPFAVLLVVAVATDSDAAYVAVGFGYVVLLLGPVVYYTVLHGGARGQTLGKRAVGIRVVHGSGERLGYGRALGRYLLVFLFGIFTLPLLVDFLWPLWDSQNQTLHDKAVGSYVVRA